MQVYSVIYITLFVGWVDLETSYVAVISLRISSFSKLEARTYTGVSPSIDVWLCWVVALDENHTSVMCHITTSTSNPRDIDQSSFATGTSLMPPEAKLTLWLDQFHSFLKSAVEIIAICYNRAGKLWFPVVSWQSWPQWYEKSWSGDQVKRIGLLEYPPGN